MRNLLKPLILGLTLALTACSSLKITTDTEKNTNNNYLTRPVQDDVFYFVLPDRFHNGDSSNDNGSKTLKISQGGYKPQHMSSYHGGDIAGLEQKLDYIQGMGVTAIWLTPILRNQTIQNGITGYHGYWILDFTEIDPHFGSKADLKSFIDAAHDRNIKVFFDVITNHTADVIKFKECHGEQGEGWSAKENKCPYKSLAQIAAGDRYTTVIPTGFENVKKPVWLNDPKYYHNQGDSNFEGENSLYGDFFGLDDLDTKNPEVVTGMIEIFKNIVSQFKPDGFRVDTVKHVHMEFWQEFSPALIEHAKSIGIPNFFIFGEVYSEQPDILSSYTTRGNLPSVLDFAFQGAVNNAVAQNKGTKALERLFAEDYQYEDQDSSANDLLNFIGNHDMGRFGYFLSKPEFNYSDEQKLARSKLAHGLMYFARGIPVVYYGDEQGFTGTGGDHLSRQDMMPSLVPEFIDDDSIGTDKTPAADNFDTSHPLYQTLKTYAQVYAAHKPLRQGTHNTIFADDHPGIYAFSRTLGDQVYYGVFNTADEEKSAPLTGDLELVYKSGDSRIESGQVVVSGLDFALYRKK
ncbi:MAG: alpha-amylase family glycosyl hydrolase [Trichodesmium sp. MAG_R03]|nr:alpha-amylase family glycosyl hydrolase [Trichodesmium sp. MAG_R03]